MLEEAQSTTDLMSLKPQLRPYIRFHVNEYRGKLWHVLTDPVSGNHFRCTERVAKFVGLLDGQRTIEQALDSCGLLDSSSKVSSGSILKVISILQSQDMLQGDILTTDSQFISRKTQSRYRKWFGRWLNPLSLRFSLWDPDKLLEKALPYFSFMLSKSGFLAILALMGVGGLLSASHWPELVHHFSARFMDPSNLLLVWLLYPVIKFIHELGHAITVKRWGGEVHDIGILFLVFIPVPYVNASSSYQFLEKHQRMLVAAAGILVELSLASIGLLVWVISENSLVREIAFNVAVIAGLSTVIINGNPLLRFDGYYFFSEWIEIPNLSQRSSQYMGYVFQRFLLGATASSFPIHAQSDRCWFLVYGLMSGLYRWLISFGIAIYVGSHYFFVGVVLGAWYFIQFLLWPIFSSVRQLIRNARRSNRRLRLLVVSSAFLVCSIVVLFVWPIKSSVYVEGVVKVPENSIVRAKSEGFLKHVLNQHGATVAKGEPLFLMENFELETKLKLVNAELLELEAREDSAFVDERIDSQIIHESVKRLQNTLQEAKQDIEQLNVISPSDGVFNVMYAEDLPGRWFHRGEVLGYVINLSNIVVYTVIPQEKLSEFRSQTKQIDIKLRSKPEQTLSGFKQAEVPLPSYRLQNAVLGTLAGGDIQVDVRDKEGLTAMEAIYAAELSLKNYTEDYLAASVAIKIQHEPEVIGKYIYQRIKLAIQKFEFR